MNLHTERGRPYTPPAPPTNQREHISDTIDAARKLITERLNAIEAEAIQLQRALMSMGEGKGFAPAAPKPRRKRAASRRRRAQAPRGKRREQLLAAIGAKPGARPSELTAEIGIAPRPGLGPARQGVPRRWSSNRAPPAR